MRTEPNRADRARSRELERRQSSGDRDGRRVSAFGRAPLGADRVTERADRPVRRTDPGRDRPRAGRGEDPRAPRIPNRPQPSRGRTADRQARSDRTDRTERADRADRAGRTERVGRLDRADRAERGGTGRSTAPVRERRRPDRAPARSKPAASRPGTARAKKSRINVKWRTRSALIILLAMLSAVVVKLTFIQGIDAQALAAQGVELRDRTTTLPATRGAITDRNGNPLAFTIEGRAIAARPQLFTDDTPPKKAPKAGATPKPLLTAQQKREKVADILVSVLGTKVTRAELLRKLTPKPGSKYVYLARAVLPAQADAITEQTAGLFDVDHQNAIATERQDIRQVPGGAEVAAAVVGTTNYDGHGQSGIESKFDGLLSGTKGSRTEQVDSRNRPIPGTISAQTLPVNGSDVQLTLDSDLQFTTEQFLIRQIAASKARSGCVVVKGVSNGQIYVMACYQPGKTAAEIGNRAISTPFEPGSVNKVVTFAAALEKGLITPATVLNVDGQIRMGGRNIHDAWPHGPIDMTATGILAKSSNVGTLMLAQQLGEDPFAAELAKFGLGRKTGIELGGESPGVVPPRTQWSATSFANLPIGQGVSMTMVQLVDMYAAIGNKGVLVPPTIIAGTSKEGVFTASKPKATSRVMSEKTSKTLLSMLTATTQSGDLYHRGTAPSAAITGYQVAGKTGTAQQVDPVTKAYSDTLTTATFAGVVPADNPKYAIAVMIDAPEHGSEGGDSAAPLFHQVAAYAMRQADVPPSAAPARVYDLYVNSAG